MIVLPAIDIKNGRCVRLRQGIKDDETVYGDSPAAMAKTFEDIGAAYIHVVDLDGAFDGLPKNLDKIEAIAQTVSIPFEIGGGIRSEQIIRRYLDAGADRVIIGTKAAEDPDFAREMIARYGERIAVSLDAKGNEVCTRGWTQGSGLDVMDLAKDLEAAGLKTLIYTDISRDGMLTGPNFEMLARLSAETGMNIIASGGVADTAHLQRAEAMGLYGAITGKAIYEHTIDLAAWLKGALC